MSISSKILTAVVLAVALAPMAAQADRDPQPGPAQYYLAPLNHQDQMMTGSATIDNPTTIYSSNANAFRDSMGG
jgi:hypothetical protein